jgi:hypothetical protein
VIDVGGWRKNELIDDGIGGGQERLRLVNEKVFFYFYYINSNVAGNEKVGARGRWKSGLWKSGPQMKTCVTKFLLKKVVVKAPIDNLLAKHVVE